MNADAERGPEQAGAFGRDFVSLMHRLLRDYESSAAEADLGAEPHGLRRRVGADFEAELEELIARHAVPETVAVYVRHVVRLGFESDFDPLDPAEAGASAQAGRAPPKLGRPDELRGG